jgi:hypothetical protein
LVPFICKEAVARGLVTEGIDKVWNFWEHWNFTSGQEFTELATGFVNRIVDPSLEC